MHNNEFTGYFLRFLILIGGFLPILFWLSLIYGFDEPCAAGITVIAAVIHEAGHEAYLLLFGHMSFSLKGVLSGFRINNTARLGYKEEIKLYIAGPAANLIVSIIALPFLNIINDYGLLFVFINLATAFSNLLPIRGHDGYGIIKTCLEMKEYGNFAFKVLRTVSFISIAVLCLFSLYLMDRYDGGYWIYGIFLLSLISEMSDSVKNSFFEN